MPNGWTPQRYGPPYRVMLVGAGTEVFFQATDEERLQVFLPRFKQMIAEWEELGARPLGTFVDDVFQMGETAEPFWAWYLIFEVDTPDIAAQLIQAARETVDGVRLDKWIRLEVRFGRPFYASEEKVPHYLVDPDRSGYRP
jgi:hypothetical protein